MTDILDAAKRRFPPGYFVYGENPTYDGTRITSRRGRTGIGIDCSNLVSQSLQAAGYNIPQLATDKIYDGKGNVTLEGSKYYTKIDPQTTTVKLGDLVMFAGHIGIVTSFKDGTGSFFGSQGRTGPAETKFATDGRKPDHYWGGTSNDGQKPFLGFLSVSAPHDPVGATKNLAVIDAKRAPALEQLGMAVPGVNSQGVKPAVQSAPGNVAPAPQRAAPAETPPVRQPRSSETGNQTAPSDRRSLDQILLDSFLSRPGPGSGARPSDGQTTSPTSPLQFAPDGADAARVIPGSNEPWPIRKLGNGLSEFSDPAPNASEDSSGRTASITIVVGAGLPGHATVQIDRGEKATYLGFGPKAAGDLKDVASYDIVTLDKDVSPVAALRNQKSGEYHYVDATQYDVKSFTLPITDEQADKAVAAAMQYRVKNPKYNGYPVLVGTDYALNVLEAAIPGSDMSALSRIPSMLQKELVSLSARGDASSPVRGGRIPIDRTGLTGLEQDEKPPQFNIKQQFNDKVPFNFASGDVGISGQARESKAQVSLTRAGDGSAELSVGDSTFVNFEPGQLASVANSDGKLRLSFSKDESRERFFGNVMVVDTGTGDVSVLDKHGKLSNLEAGSRINITSARWDHASEMRPNELERAGSERTAAGFG